MAYLGWLVEQAAFVGRIRDLANAGRQDRRGRRAWREYPVGECEVSRADHDFYAPQRKLEGVLPPSCRPLIPRLVLGYDSGPRVPIEDIEIPPGEALPPAHARRLKDLCLRLLGDGPALSGAEREFKRQALADLDRGPDLEVLLVAKPQGRSVELGEPVAISATEAAAGRWRAYPSQAGYPVVGTAATLGPWGVGIAPEPVPRSGATRWRPDHFGLYVKPGAGRR